MDFFNVKDWVMNPSKDAHRISYIPGDGNWNIGDNELKILNLNNLVPFLIKDNLKTIPLKEIAWRGKHNFPYFTEELQTERYKNCNTKYPGIILYNAPNPYDNKYRMIDGRHRIIKLLREGVTESLYYTLNFNDIKHLIEYDLSRKYNISLTTRTKYS